ncbi:3,4-dihydroxy-2-butanone-4-phosphate synthase [Agrobacterium sp. MOPV5]|uniref:3,4-dihydroxy-2-butanone-4-phosphate synthase n=1 Tax=Agrobacterium leguminum TaxID=2792015 RepID=UPI0018C2D902|nr:3,4-dihydroxy-2-butanone-4-phosphate synthase [Agrobacterium leguminum]MBG0512099.1 3,4-dihydroxy-2-butanone-4-phosphate synthase [Agrobacterium leguminum]
MTISRVADAIAAMRGGKMVIVVDDHDRENEGDLIIASEVVTDEAIAFMMNRARGLVCIAMEGERLDELGLPLMVARNSDSFQTAFTVSVDFIPGTTTGISASDRATTVRALVNPKARPEEFARPGHMFPLRAHPLGVFGRQGHTEAAVDLARLAGFVPSAVICEISNNDGSMARLPELERFAERHDIHLITIEDLAAHRMSIEDFSKIRSQEVA